MRGEREPGEDTFTGGVPSGGRSGSRRGGRPRGYQPAFTPSYAFWQVASVAWVASFRMAFFQTFLATFSRSRVAAGTRGAYFLSVLMDALVNLPQAGPVVFW